MGDRLITVNMGRKVMAGHRCCASFRGGAGSAGFLSKAVVPCETKIILKNIRMFQCFIKQEPHLE